MKKVLLLLLLLLDISAAMEVAESPGSISGAISAPLRNESPAETKPAPYTELTLTPQEIIRNVALQSPGVSKAVVVSDLSHIGVTIEPGPYATSSDLSIALGRILAVYVRILSLVPEYSGYLRIGIYKGGKITNIYEISAWETRNARDAMDLYNSLVSSEKSISYYLSDGWGDVTKSASIPGYGRLSASAGNWL